MELHSNGTNSNGELKHSDRPVRITYQTRSDISIIQARDSSRSFQLAEVPRLSGQMGLEKDDLIYKLCGMVRVFRVLRPMRSLRLFGVSTITAIGCCTAVDAMGAY